MKGFCIILLAALIFVVQAQQDNGNAKYCPYSNSTYIYGATSDFSSPYNCFLTKDAVSSPTEDQMDITIAPCTTCGGLASSCEIARSTKTSGWGFYNCDLKVQGIAGTVTSCMVESTTQSGYENIYMKFFGNETGKIFVGFYTNGRVQQAGPIELKFDPTLRFHSYSFLWAPGFLKFYVDGTERSSEYGSRTIPTVPNRFTIGLVTEDPNVYSDNSAYDTQMVNRVFDSIVTPTVVSSFKNVTYTPLQQNADIVACPEAGINPGPGQETATACDTRKERAIYDDAPRNDWTIAISTGSKIADETSQLHTGTKSLAYTILGTSPSITISGPAFFSTDFYAVEFWINGGQYGNQKVNVAALLEDGSATSTYDVATALLGVGGIQAGTWNRVVMPFSDFQIAPETSTSIIGFILTFPAATIGGDLGRTIFLDDFYLVQRLPICANSTSYIYQDGLAKGVKDESYNGQYSFTQTAVVADGERAIQWDMYGYAGLRFKFAEPYDSNKWEAVSFRINLIAGGGVLPGWNIYFTAVGSTAENARAGGAPLNLIKYNGGVNPNGEWPLVVLPLRAFGIGIETKLDALVFQCEQNDFQGTIYLDDIAMISSQVEAEEERSSTSSASLVRSSASFFFALFLVYLIL